MPSETRSRRPNVVLICADQWRGDCLGVAGHPVVHTPYLNDLARAGCRFAAAYTASPTCIAARAGLMTGLAPKSHGRVGYQDGVPWDYETYLSGEFTRHGHQTQAIGKMRVFPERSQCGFQNVILHDGYLHHARRRAGGRIEAIDDYIPWLRARTGNPEADYFDNGLNCNSYAARPQDRAEGAAPEPISLWRRRTPSSSGGTPASRSSCICHSTGRIRRSTRRHGRSSSTWGWSCQSRAWVDGPRASRLSAGISAPTCAPGGCAPIFFGA